MPDGYSQPTGIDDNPLEYSALEAAVQLLDN
jgi:hypothetical protein